MARIRAANTSPERELRRALTAAGLRYRLQYRTPGGRADVALPGKRIAVFVDGCFWHGCPDHYVRPRTRNAFWDKKLKENVDRDRRQAAALKEAGWRMVRVWEHELREAPQEVAERILRQLNRKAPSPRPMWRVVFVEVVDAASDLERRFLQQLCRPVVTKVEERIRWTGKVGRASRPKRNG